MEETKGKEQTIFVCPRFKGLLMVVKPDDVITDKWGRSRNSPGKHLQFINNGYGGEYRTSDPEEIEFIKTSELFRTGKIIIVNSPREELKPVPTGPEVHNGSVDSRATTIATPAPKEDTPAVSKKVKTPKR